LAELIVTVAAERNLSLTKVAKAAGWSSVNAITYYTNGRWPRRPIPQEVQQQIADGLGIDVWRVTEAVKASTGETDELDLAGLTTAQRVVLAAMRKADEETQRFVAEITLSATEFAERHIPASRAESLREVRDDT